MSSPSRTLVNIHNFDKSKLSVAKINDSNYTILYNEKPFTLEIGPETKELEYAKFCYGLKYNTTKDGDPLTPTITLPLGVNTSNFNSKMNATILSVFSDLASEMSNKIENTVEPIIYQKPLNPPLLSLKCKYFKESDKILTKFRRNNKPIKNMEELEIPFWGVFFVNINNITKSKQGKWYVNSAIDTCIVSTRCLVELESDYK